MKWSKATRSCIVFYCSYKRIGYAVVTLTNKVVRKLLRKKEYVQLMLAELIIILEVE